MTPPATIVFPVDVDNTLLDNDHIQGTFRRQPERGDLRERQATHLLPGRHDPSRA
jgi:hypothetical protein